MKALQFLFIILTLSFSSFAQTEEKRPRGAVKFGLEVNPIVNISALKQIKGSTLKRNQLGIIFNGAMYVNRLTTLLGIGYVTNNVENKTTNSTYQIKRNSLVGQLAIFKRYVRLDIFNESQLNIGLGGIGIFQIGNEDTQVSDIETTVRKFNSITLAPAVRTQLVITKFLSFHTQLGFGVSLNHENYNGFDNTNVRFEPLQRANFLGQTGFTIYM